MVIFCVCCTKKSILKVKNKTKKSHLIYFIDCISFLGIVDRINCNNSYISTLLGCHLPFEGRIYLFRACLSVLEGNQSVEDSFIFIQRGEHDIWSRPCPSQPSVL